MRIQISYPQLREMLNSIFTKMEKDGIVIDAVLGFETADNDRFGARDNTEVLVAQMTASMLKKPLVMVTNQQTQLPSLPYKHILIPRAVVQDVVLPDRVIDLSDIEQAFNYYTRTRHVVTTMSLFYGEKHNGFTPDYIHTKLIENSNIVFPYLQESA